MTICYVGFDVKNFNDPENAKVLDRHGSVGAWTKRKLTRVPESAPEDTTPFPLIRHGLGGWGSRSVRQGLGGKWTLEKVITEDVWSDHDTVTVAEPLLAHGFGG